MLLTLCRNGLGLFHCATMAGLLLAGASARAAVAADSTPPGRGRPWKLLFSGPGDVSDTWGRLHFGVTPVGLLSEGDGPGFNFVGAFPESDGVWAAFGQEVVERSPGDAVKRMVVWRLLRAATTDGVHFGKVETVYESAPAAWTDHLAVARNGRTGEYLLLKLKVDSSGFGYTAFVSADGQRWAESPGNPLFYDGDAMSLFWSPVLERFVCINKGLQPFRKRLIDHGGPTPALGDDTLRDRRVLMMRSSRDGRNWEPSVSLSDVWNRNGRKAPLPSGYLTEPDAEDPPDLEFYSGNGFWYHDRAYMLVLNYAASPLAPRKHGPHLDNEWWTSRDGWRWERPARGVNALEVFPAVPRLETHPLVLGGRILFPRGRQLLGLTEDRLSYVGARANGEFSTRSFVMPAGGLRLNAAIPAPDRPYAREQAYVLASILDERGVVLPGYTPDRCVLQREDRPDVPLKWGDVTGAELAGRNVRLRLALRAANIYAVTTLPTP